MGITMIMGITITGTMTMDITITGIMGIITDAAAPASGL